MKNETGKKKTTAPDTSVGADDGPVSYTHLDVYKRQLLYG